MFSNLMATPLTMKTILAAPLWFLQLFSTAKSFRDNPLIGSPLLNRLGLHVLRLLLAHGSMNLRMWLLGWGVDRATRQSYRRDGFLLQENCIPAELFAQIEAEIRQHPEPGRLFRQGDTQTRRILLDPDTLQQLPHTRRWLQDKTLRRLLRYTAGHSRLPFFNIEEINNGMRDSNGHDPQKDLHADTFHPTMKFWLYLDDVDEHNGPFTYVPTSQQLSLRRLRWEDRFSLNARHAPELSSARGSFRFHPQDLA
ncbi:MAG: phytanoyl-CoA dioxygenase family protein [Thiolinea sp.]